MSDFYNALHINEDNSHLMEDDVVEVSSNRSNKMPFQNILSTSEESNCYYDFSRIQMGKVLGHGATGRVCEASVPTLVHGVPSRPTKFAVKVLKPTQAGKTFHREKNALEQLKSLPSVVRLHAAREDVPIEGKLSNVLYLEHCTHGEYFDVLEKFQYGLPEQLARHYAKELWRSIAQCHEAGVQHRDIKPENILVAEDWTLRLADFGSALVGFQNASVEYCGTEQYIAPEVSRSVAYSPEAADCWSMAVTVFITLYGIPPFFEATNKCWYYRCVRDKNWQRFWSQQEKARPNAPKLSQSAKSFLEQALDPNPMTRPSAVDMLQHDWLWEADEPIDVENFLAENEMPDLGI